MTAQLLTARAWTSLIIGKVRLDLFTELLSLQLTYKKKRELNSHAKLEEKDEEEILAHFQDMPKSRHP